MISNLKIHSKFLRYKEGSCHYSKKEQRLIYYHRDVSMSLWKESESVSQLAMSTSQHQFMTYMYKQLLNHVLSWNIKMHFFTQIRILITKENTRTSFYLNKKQNINISVQRTTQRCFSCQASFFCRLPK